MLTDVAALGKHVRNWRSMLPVGLEAGDSVEDADAEAVEARMRTGRPLASADWIADAEAAMKRKLAPERRGPKPRNNSAAN